VRRHGRAGRFLHDHDESTGKRHWIEAATSVIAIGLAFVLIPRYGILGAAMVVAAGSAVRNLSMFVALWRQLGLRSTIF